MPWKYCENGIKKCCKCKIEKSIQEFSLVKNGKLEGYHSSFCKKCNVIRSREHDLKTNYRHNYYQRKKKYFRKHGKKVYKEKTNRWLPFLPSNPTCEVCGKYLTYFNKKGTKKGVFFDHKHSNLPIKALPTIWLKANYPTEQNVKLWASCNFGILCRRCNIRLPTNNRKKWLKNVTNYILKNTKGE